MAEGCFLAKLYLYLTFSLLASTVSLSSDLERQHTGVQFSPKVKHSLKNGSFPSEDSYSIKDIEVMLEVISTKFSKILTFDPITPNASYVWNYTYNQSDLNVYVSEAAANFNKKHNEKKFSVLQKAFLFEDTPRDITQIMTAMECVEKANYIYPGTVEGIVLSNDNDFSHNGDAERILYMMKLVRSFNKNIKVGTKFLCESAPTRQLGNEDGNQLWQVYNQILLNSDFLVCQFDPSERARLNSPNTSFYSIVDFIKQFNTTMPVGSKIELMALLWWSSGEEEFWCTVQNMKEYWEAATTWAANNKFTIYFVEAFDEPKWKWPHNGWWKLTDNSKIGDVNGYVEKIKEVKEESEKNSTAIILIVISAVIIFSVLSSLSIFLLVRMHKLQQTLSQKDIQKFVEGATDPVVMHQHDDCAVNNVAHMLPYDYSYEMAIEQLKIDYNKVLGTGQFGRVYGATIVTGNNSAPVQVAFKVAKNECSRTALKALLSEIKILIYLHQHPNIVQLKGAYTTELNKGVLYVATELCGLGCLKSYLKKHSKIQGHDNDISHGGSFNSAYVNTREPISFHQSLQWSQAIAAGMEYLGTKNVVHADLATRNVLLTWDKTAKISDFGLSRRMYDYTNYTKTGVEPLPWRWMAIESLKRGEFSAKSDVWSYGVTLWEIFTMGTCDIPYPGLAWTVNFSNMLADGMRLGPPPHCKATLYTLMVDCWHLEADERPSFSQIKQKIENISVDSGGRRCCYR